MMRPVDLLQPTLHDMGVDLRCRNVGVAEHQLNRAQVGAALEQMGGETVPELVRGQPATQSGPAAVRLKDSPEANAADTSAVAIEKKSGRKPIAKQFRASDAQIAFERRQGSATDRNHALLASLPGATKIARFTLNVFDAKADQLGDAQSGTVQHLEHGFIADAEGGRKVGLGQQAIHFLQGQKAGQALMDARGFQMLRGIVSNPLLGNRHAEEIAQRNQMARDTAAIEPLAIEVGEEIDNVSARNIPERASAPPDKVAKLGEVGAVSEVGVFREPLLHSKVSEEDPNGGIDTGLVLA